MAAKVFISYRRSDSAATCGRIYDRLIAQFGRETVFKDVDSIPIGSDFKAYIESVMLECVVAIIVIGPHWLDSRDAGGRRRLDDPYDLVRLEVEAAIRRGMPIVPLLVDRAHLPATDQLPASLRPLTVRNGMEIRYDPDFNHDMARLISAVESLVSPHRSSEVSSSPEALDRAAKLVENQRPRDAMPLLEQLTGANPDNKKAWFLLGEARFDTEQLDDAFVAYERALALDPSDAKAWMRKGQVLTAMNQHEGDWTRAVPRREAAREAYLRSVALYKQKSDTGPGDMSVWTGLIEALEVLNYDEHDFGVRKLREAEIAKAYERATQLDSSLTEMWYGLASKLHSLRRDEEALRACDRALALAPNDHHLWSLKRRIVEKVDSAKADEARQRTIAALDRAIALDPDNVDLYHDRAHEIPSWKEDEFKAARRHAVDVARRIALRRSRDIAAWLKLAQIAEPQETLDAYEHVLALNPNDEEVWLAKGNWLAGPLRDPLAALAAFDHALAIDQSCAGAWTGKASAQAANGHSDDALATYESALSILPNHLGIWVGFGDLLATLHRHEDALAAYDHAAALDMMDRGVWSQKERLLQQMKRPNDLLDVYTHKLMIDPSDDLTWWSKGWLLFRLRRYAEALECYVRACAAYPDRLYNWTEKGRALHELGRYYEALEAYERGAEGIDLSDPSDSSGFRESILYLRARSLAGLRHQDEARTLLQEVAAYRGNEDTGRVYKAHALRDLGQYADALTEYDYVLSRRPSEPYDALIGKATTLRLLGRESEAIELERKAMP